jgi:hypothetical protein
VPCRITVIGRSSTERPISVSTSTGIANASIGVGVVAV